ncbi:neurogenic locus notch homolog protein 1 [Daphnia magna]|uniref:EGF-like domain-containing protein n=1 Tax=Daphnia magna TaxID=35525 RepID=A0ABQ9ZPW1_9CRUS|nr:neurogenic locus notch homolog protein 1 [Daphnia magna]KAK4014726.1 hypothetical protein OUZ56_027236 [Daphnia magna]
MVGMLALSLLIAQAAAMGGFSGNDPCSPYPCGPNTDCMVSPLGVAVCRCKSGFFPKPDTITGCGPQCDDDDDCSNTQNCARGRCVNICEEGICGINAVCEPRNRRAICRCPSGYSGDPFTRCTAGHTDQRILTGSSSSHSSFNSNPFSGNRQTIVTGSDSFGGSFSSAPVSSSSFGSSSSSFSPAAGSSFTSSSSTFGDDPCANFNCGSNANCLLRSFRAVCACRAGYEGDPYTGCRRSECVENNECPTDKVCHNNRCINPCSTSCGVDSECTVRNHVTVCQCPKGFTGDPFVSCNPSSSSNLASRQTGGDYCTPTPCGANSKCRVENNRAVCSCQDGFMGNPIEGCRRECETDSQCDANRACLGFRCTDPCGSCGTYADCNVRNHRAICSCPANFLGDPYSRCYPECTQHEECRPSQACFNLKCVDPCQGACGDRAECRVENHKAICSCPKGYTGHPFTACRPFDKSDLCNPNPCGTDADCKPGTDRQGNDRPVCFCRVGYLGDPLVGCRRGQCIDHADCPGQQACYGYQCVDPCTSTSSSRSSVCGIGARCDARNHGAVCSCPIGQDGDPLVECRASFRG